MIVKQAFGGMKNIVLANTESREMIDHIVEIAPVRLVGADILRRVDGVEIDAKLLVA